MNMKKELKKDHKELIGISRVIFEMEKNYNTEYRKVGISLTYGQKQKLSRNLFK